MDFNLDDDFIEVGGLVPLKDGWFLEKSTGKFIDPSGNVYGPDGSCLHGPNRDDLR